MQAMMRGMRQRGWGAGVAAVGVLKRYPSGPVQSVLRGWSQRLCEMSHAGRGAGGRKSFTGMAQPGFDVQRLVVPAFTLLPTL
jgi:hypothetical protein